MQALFDRLKREFATEVEFRSDNTAVSKNGAIFLTFIPNKLSLSVSLTDSAPSDNSLTLADAATRFAAIVCPTITKPSEWFEIVCAYAGASSEMTHRTEKQIGAETFGCLYDKTNSVFEAYLEARTTEPK
jgi:hypothetical protein